MLYFLFCLLLLFPSAYTTPQDAVTGSIAAGGAKVAVHQVKSA